ncbi:MAG: rod shape-determining protein RodA [Desulfurivibrio sp.]|nr:rod shape-determining protein RodA [Desulfurivibrio sp.]
MLRFDRRLLQNFDWVMVAAVLLVGLLGLLNLYSASSLDRELGSAVFVKQLSYFLLGFMVILVITLVDYKVLIKWNYPIYGLALFLLLAVLLVGGEVAGTQRWLNFVFFRLQPSEPAKLALVITLASYYYRKDTGKGFTIKELLLPIALAAVPFGLIIMQPDLGTGMMLGFIFLSMTLFVKLKWSAILSMAGAAAAVIPLGWKFYLKPYQQERILTFLSPDSNPLGSGYHITQSKIAVGSGTTFGKGYMEGTQAHLDFLPERHTDFAFSVWAEEWGFIGSLFFLACYFFIILWGMNIALTARDKFGVLLAFGVVSLIFWQATINLGMVLGLLPVVGMPLPLFSYGGSSLLTTMAGIGILINIRMRRFMTP